MHCPLLESARRHFFATEQSPRWKDYIAQQPLSRIWSGENAVRMRQLLVGSSDAAEAVARLQGFWFQGVPTRRESELAVSWHLANLKRNGVVLADLPAYCQEVPPVPEQALVNVESRSLRPDFFRHLGAFLRVVPHLTETAGRKRFLEL